MTPQQMLHMMLNEAMTKGTSMMRMTHDGKGNITQELVDPYDQIGHAMNEVAQRFAHRLALDLECVLARYSGPWYDEAMQTLSEYRTAMNELHEKQAPTFMGEPLVRDGK